MDRNGVDLPGKDSYGITRFRFNRTAIEQAKAELLIESPLMVRLFSGAPNHWGKYTCKQNTDNTGNTGIHYIRINESLTQTLASHTLWHELTHAAQAEHVAKEAGLPLWEFWIVYNSNRGQWGAEYKNNRFEVEARNIADAHKDQLLTKLPPIKEMDPMKW